MVFGGLAAGFNGGLNGFGFWRLKRKNFKKTQNLDVHRWVPSRRADPQVVSLAMDTFRPSVAQHPVLSNMARLWF